MKDIFRAHLRKYPMSEPRDMVKLAYQSEFGSGHMLPSREIAVNRLKSELEAVKQTEVCNFEKIGGGLLRFPLSGLTASGLSEETVVGLFSAACAPMRGSVEGLKNRLRSLTELCESGKTPFPPDALRAYLAEYEKAGYPAVSHSEAYRAAYAPAYRLVPDAARKYLALLAKIDAVLRINERAVVKIDGNSGAGKSTLGAFLQTVYGANLFHMDDYFLPSARKTPERLAQPGGNVDYERFQAEIDGRKPGESFQYRPYSCAAGALGAPVTVSPARVHVIEGVYSMHPALGKPDVSAFLSLDPETQSARIRKRNGAAMHKRFMEVWIPLENAYFEAFGIRNACDLAFEEGKM